MKKQNDRRVELEVYERLLAAAKHALPGCVGESAKLLTDAIAKAEEHEKTK